MHRIAVLLLTLLLAGCSAAEPQTPTATGDSGSPTSGSTPIMKSPEPEADAEPVPDDMAACSEVADLLLPVQTIVTAIIEDGTGSSIDQALLSRTARALREAAPLVTSRMNTYYAPFSSIVLQLDDIYAGRSDPSVSLDTGAYRDAAIDIMTYCVEDVGYRAP